MTEDGFAEIIERDGAQLVMLPDEMRLPGTQVRVSRSGNGILLEPMVEKKSREEILAILAELDRFAEECGPSLPEERRQPPLPDDDAWEFVAPPPIEQMRAGLARLDAFGDIPFMENGREQPPMPDDDDLPAFDA